MPGKDMHTGGNSGEIALEVRGPRYHITMKKSTLKLALHHETLRVLAKVDLVRVAGGNPETQLMDTEGPNNTCVVAKAAPATKP